MRKQSVEEAAGGAALENVTDTLLAGLLTQDEAAAELKICQRTLDRWRRLGEGPPTTKLGRRVLYRRSSLQAWLRTRERRGDAA
jgi:predicted DNA-binding transcriptional regulator AlpA